MNLAFFVEQYSLYFRLRDNDEGLSSNFGVTGAYDVSDQNLMTKAERVGRLSVRSHYIDGRLATDLLKINASDLRQSHVFSYRHTADRTSFPCKHRTRTLASTVVREDPVANKTWK